MKAIRWIIIYAVIGALLVAWLLPTADVNPKSRNEGALLVLILVLAGIGLAIGLATKLGRDSRNDPPAP